MFKKREVKKHNLDIDAINCENTNTNKNLDEPIIQKKTKTIAHYTTQTKTNEIKQQTSTLMDDFHYKASQTLIDDTLATSILDLDLLQNEQRKIQESNQENPSKYKIKATPLPQPKCFQANQFKRISENIDYNPSLCKDYHDTGYCCFGDSCIYIHDRGDYKSGWELEKEYNEQRKREAEEIQEDDQEIPQGCVGCGGEIEGVTGCGCEVCERCFLEGYREGCKGCGRKKMDSWNSIRKVKQFVQKEEVGQSEGEELEFQKVIQSLQKDKDNRQKKWEDKGFYDVN